MSQPANFYRELLDRLCNCARSRGRHSTYCPTLTAAPRIVAAVEGALDAAKPDQDEPR